VADRGYRGLAKFCAASRLALDIKAPPAGAAGFVPLRPLWKVEHAFSWLGRYRRPTRSFEGTAASARAWAEVAATGYLLSRLR
jgi:transposase